VRVAVESILEMSLPVIRCKTCRSEEYQTTGPAQDGKVPIKCLGCGHTGMVPAKALAELVGITPAPYVPGSATSVEAAARITESAATLREKVFALLNANPGGLTDEQQQRALGMNPSTQRPRRIELVEQGRVRDSGRTALTRSNRQAVVWEVVRADSGGSG